MTLFQFDLSVLSILALHSIFDKIELSILPHVIKFKELT